MKMKKILPYILIIVLVFEMFFGLFAYKKAYANGDTGPSEYSVGKGYGSLNVNNQSQNSSPKLMEFCDLFSLDVGGCILQILANVAQDTIWQLANLALGIGGWMLDTGISMSITGSIFRDLATGGAVTAGWGFARDIVNLFLIFILLFIAIAIILQVSRFGSKELLITLIIVAFLVNFSLVITRLVIDASNVLAVEFYKAFPTKTGTDGKTTTTISLAFRNAFNLQTVVDSNLQNFANAPGGSGNATTDAKNAYLTLFLTYTLGSLVCFIAAFIFIIIAILFFIRMVVLLILMVLAPLAFAAHVLPSTKSHSSKWWDSLFSQAFFAPAALFMLWLSAKMAGSGFIQDTLNVGNKGLSNMLVSAAAKGLDWDNIAKFSLQFVIIAIMLLASLVIAKQMGAAGANSVINAGTKAARKVQGYAGRATARTVIARPARALAESELGKKIGRIPLIGGAIYRGTERAAKAGKLEELTERRVATKVKLGQTLSTSEMTNYFPKLDARSQEALYSKLSEKQRASVEATMPNIFDGMFARMRSTMGEGTVTEMKAKLGNNMPNATARSNFFQNQNEQTQMKMIESMSARERIELKKLLPTAFTTTLGASFDDLINSLPVDEREQTEKRGKEAVRKEEVKNLTIDQSTVSTTQFTTAISLTKPEEMSELHKSIALDPVKINEMLKVISINHLNKIEDRGDELSDAVIDALYALDATGTKNAANIIAALRAPAINNQRLARAIETGPVRAKLGLT